MRLDFALIYSVLLKTCDGFFTTLLPVNITETNADLTNLLGQGEPVMCKACHFLTSVPRLILCKVPSQLFCDGVTIILTFVVVVVLSVDFLDCILFRPHCQHCKQSARCRLFLCVSQHMFLSVCLSW